MTLLNSTTKYYHFSNGNNLISVNKIEARNDINKAFMIAIDRLNNINGIFKSKSF